MNKTLDIESLDWKKSGGMLPAIIQDAASEAVLMLGYMNREALEQTLQRGRVVFFSRTRDRLWEKGETSGNTLEVVSVVTDCHRNTPSCFGDGALPRADGLGFLAQLETVIASRIAQSPEGSYTAKLYGQGLKRMAQKVGEEGVEVALAAQSGDNRELVSESADLLFHLALLLRARDLSLDAVGAELAARHRARS